MTTNTALNAPHFQDADKAREYLEALRWPNGPVCPHCGSISHDHYALKGKSHRPGIWKCKDCREQFSVTVGTVFERSKIGINVWLQAVYLLCSSKKGISSHQLHRTLGVTYKTAWFMSHRIREAMAGNDGGLFGSGGGTVESDETFIGTVPAQRIAKSRKKIDKGTSSKNKILSLIDRTTGQARSVVIENLRVKTILPILQENIAPEARVMTDEAKWYARLNEHFAQHGSTIHSNGQYVDRDDKTIHTNTVEGFFSIFKRGMKGVYQHCDSSHLQRYLAEFDFRYSNRAKLEIDDAERTVKALKGIEGKRLTYRRTNRQKKAEANALAN